MKVHDVNPREKSKNKKERSLYYWSLKQKRSYSKNKLSDLKIEKLESLQDKWKWKNQELDDDKWNEKYELLLEFVDEFKKLPKQNEEYRDVKICQWISNQCENYKHGRISIDKIEKLENIKYDDKKIWKWSTNNDIWNDRYELLLEFIEKYKKLPVGKNEYKTIKIGLWCQTQRCKYKKNELSEDRIEKLENIKHNNKKIWVWVIDQWEENFELLLEFIDEYERLPRNNENI